MTWKLKDIPKKNGCKVFSTFSCGGGSSMGYKLAGYDVIGNVEIDPDMNDMYQLNLHPRFTYTMDLREFNEISVPDELIGIDILDGSPPCSTFSMSGQREDAWGKEKYFREGQQKQVLDDLFFVFLETVKKLNPRVVVAENVEGIIKGNAKGYVNAILNEFKRLGYEVQLFRLNAADMGVPQTRVRIFFIANREGFPKLKLNFNEKKIPFGKIRSETGEPLRDGIMTELLKSLTQDDKSFADISKRVRGKGSNFNSRIIHDRNIADTLTSNGSFIRAYDKMKLSKEDIVNISSFPDDYDFNGNNVQFVCGMSVPPLMMKRISEQIYKQWLR